MQLVQLLPQELFKEEAQKAEEEAKERERRGRGSHGGPIPQDRLSTKWGR